MSHPTRHVCARCRGSAYIAVLGTTMLVTLLGVSAMIALRLERLTQQAGAETDQAALLAHSALELGLAETRHAEWRKDHKHGVWSDPVALGGGTVRYRFVDTDGVLHNDDADRVTIEGEATFGPADAPRTRRRASVELNPALRRNGAGAMSVVANGGMDGTSDWFATVLGEVELDAKDSSGEEFLRVKDRSSPEMGIRQDLTDRLTTPGPYEVLVRARMREMNDWLNVKVFTRRDGEIDTFTLQRPVTESWTAIDGTLDITWTEAPENVWLEITTSSSQEFEIDDISIRPNTDGPAPVVPGSWRQVVLMNE